MIAFHGSLVDIVVEMGEEDEEHLDEFLDREFLLLLCLVLECIEIDLAHAPVYRILRVGTDPGILPFFAAAPLISRFVQCFAMMKSFRRPTYWAGKMITFLFDIVRIDIDERAAGICFRLAEERDLGIEQFFCLGKEPAYWLG